MSQLTCPKCGAEMRTYERNGVAVDQCGSCRGIFLDRGELERLMDAESGFYGGAAPAAPAAPQPYGERRREHSRDDSRDDYRHHGSGHYPKRRKSFLAELFD